MSHFTSITDGKYQHPATALEALPDYRESNRSSPLRHFPFNHTRKVSSLHMTAVQGYIALIKKHSLSVLGKKMSIQHSQVQSDSVWAAGHYNDRRPV